MLTVTYGKGDIAVVSERGEVVYGGDKALRDALRRNHSRDVPGDAVRTWRPGDDGHIEAALRSLPLAIVTNDA
jgi:hypothetical protein